MAVEIYPFWLPTAMLASRFALIFTGARFYLFFPLIHLHLPPPILTPRSSGHRPPGVLCLPEVSWLASSLGRWLAQSL